MTTKIQKRTIKQRKKGMQTLHYLYVKSPYHEGLGRQLATSRHSRPLSQDSTGSPEAYLIDSVSSIFLKRQPESEETSDSQCISKVTKNHLECHTPKSKARYSSEIPEREPSTPVAGARLCSSNCWRSFRDKDLPVPS